MSGRRAESEAWLVLPTYNEAENLLRVVSSAREHLPPGSQILIVDDDSPDGTGEIAAALAEQDQTVHLLSRRTREGLGPAYLAGFRYALERGADSICQMDADFSHDPAAIPDLLSTLENADVVLGSRYVEGGSIENWSLLRRMISRCGNVYCRLLLGVPVRDLTGGFKAFRRDVAELLVKAEIAAQGYAFQIETTYRAINAGCVVVEIPITFRDREYGASKMTAAIAIEAAWRAPLMRWRVQRD